MKKVISLLLILSILLSFTGCKATDYKDALAAMELGLYSDAALTFEALGDYKDSSRQLIECRYALAERHFEDGNYEEARQAFEALGDHRESNEYIQKCNYNLAKEAYDRKEYEEALELFRQIGDYIDVQHYVTECANAILIAKLEGEWVSDPVDLMPIMTEVFYSMDEALGLVCESIDTVCPMNMDLSFTAEELCTMRASIVDMDGFRETVKTLISDYFLTVIETSLAEEGYTMEDLYAEIGSDDPNDVIFMVMGCTIDDMIDVMELENMLEQTLEGMSQECFYWIKDGQIICNNDVFVYNEDTDTLTNQLDEESAEYLGISSLTFHRK